MASTTVPNTVANIHAKKGPNPMTDDEKIAESIRVIDVLMAIDGVCPDCGHPGLDHRVVPETYDWVFRGDVLLYRMPKVACRVQEVTQRNSYGDVIDADLCSCKGLSFWPIAERSQMLSPLWLPDWGK